MKKIKKCLSIILVFVMLLLSTVSVVAETSNEALHLENKCSQKVMEFLKGESDLALSQAYSDERLPVYIWYKDIDQDYVDTRTEEVTGLSAEECSRIDDVYHGSLNYKSVDFSKTDEELLNAYIESTRYLRKLEKANVERYTKARREIAAELYKHKSDTLIDAVKIDNEYINFDSQFAPMIIANLTAEEINRATKNDDVELISYYEEPYFESDTLDSAITITQVDKINEGSNLNLSGENVKVGLIDETRVSFSTEQPDYGIVLDNPNNPSVYYQNNIPFKDYGNVVVVGNLGTPNYNEGKPHADKTSNSLLTVAPNIKLYTSVWSYNCIEAMILDGVQILSVSMSDYISVTESSDDFAYSSIERWFDHLVSYHGITVVKSAGNTGHNTLRVGNPGMAYNIITVGAYHESSEVDGHELNDRFASYSLSLNSYDGKHGCEKPDVVATANFNGGGTSNATPFLAGTIALMLELKPSLSNYPHLIKSIVLASCHRKVIQDSVDGPQESMSSNSMGRQSANSLSGITERQGAGAPDAWTMASIICQGTYSLGVNNGTEVNVNIEQPKYGANYMNVSLSCIKENVPINGHSISDIEEGITNNLELQISQNNSIIKSSELWFSSTEMCYVPLSSSDYKYKLTIKQNTSPNPTKYAVAWSTDVMRAAPKSAPFSDLNGIYCIRNVANSRYLTLNSSATDDWQKAKLNAFSTTNSNNSSGNQKWIVNTSNYGYNIKTGFGSIEDYVGVSSVYNGSSLYSNVSSSLCCFNIEMNKDGTYSVFNSDKSRIMSYDSSRYIIWVPYLDDQDVSSKEKWTFEKVNFIPGDADANGIIDNSDVSYVQNILAHNITPTNIERYLSDADRNGTVNILDANRIFNLIDNTYIY